VCEKEKLKTQEGQDIFEYMLDAHIIKKRNDYDGFESHVQKVEKEFWEKYKATRAWQENQYKFYEKYGYVETLTGFRFTGYMTRNKLVNYPIQGSAFHCLLYSLIHTHNYLLDHEMLSKILGQIHDCLLFDVYPPERDKIVRVSHEIACEQIRREWKWIIVPLVIEVEETAIDGSWYSKVETREEDGFFDIEGEEE
jgi:DNA polymerase I-like protein with 3'-5' exonuclease and polymerase domains